MELVRLAMPLELSSNLRHICRRGILVGLAKQAEDRP
jgi:hypothetical protein